MDPKKDTSEAQEPRGEAISSEADESLRDRSTDLLLRAWAELQAMRREQ